MGKWETWDVKLFGWVWMHLFVCMSRVARGGQGGESCSVWKRRKLGGSVWRGRIHLFCIYLQRRPSEHGWQMSGECGDDTRAVVLFITISAQLCSALSSPLMAHHSETRGLNTAEWAENCSTGHGGHSEDFLCFTIRIFWLISLQIRKVSAGFPRSRKRNWTVKQNKST